MAPMSRVLIFDDDKDILELCSIILAQEGYETFTEASSRKVIERINETSPDVILMDIWIPGLGGVEAIQLIKRAPGINQVPIILFSANNNIENIAKEAGADYFLKKPFDIITLSNTVSQALKLSQATSH
jgi:CheY-like chemotaxis protein